MEAFKEFEEEETSTNQPKTIVELRVAPSDGHRAQFLEDYYHCCLCKTKLMFTYNTDFISLDVKEEAFCPTCQIRIKQEDHCLH